MVFIRKPTSEYFRTRITILEGGAFFIENLLTDYKTTLKKVSTISPTTSFLGRSGSEICLHSLDHQTADLKKNFSFWTSLVNCRARTCSSLKACKPARV
jgi:hypothetical protein